MNREPILFQTADAGGGAAGRGAAGEKPKEAAYFPQVSPELRKNDVAQKLGAKYPGINELLQGAIDMEARLARAVIIPSMDKPDPGELKAFREAMGLPEKEEDYPIQADAKDVEATALAGLVRKQSMAMGLTKVQGQKLFEFLQGARKTAAEQAAAERKKAEESYEARLLEAVGKDESKKTETAALLKRFLVKRIADPALIQKLADSGLIHEPAFALAIAQNVEQYLGEEPMARGAAQGGRGGAGGQGKGEQKGTLGDYSPEFQEAFGEKQ